MAAAESGPSPNPRKLASESPTSSTLIGPPVPAATVVTLADVPGSLPVVGLATAGTAVTAVVAPAVTATTKAAVPPTAKGADIHPFQPRRTPRRTGISRKWNDAAATANDSPTRTTNSGHPARPVRAWSTHTKMGQWNRYRP